jgi:hypothetical protein
MADDKHVRLETKKEGAGEKRAFQGPVLLHEALVQLG